METGQTIGQKIYLCCAQTVRIKEMPSYYAAKPSHIMNPKLKTEKRERLKESNILKRRQRELQLGRKREFTNRLRLL